MIFLICEYQFGTVYAIFTMRTIMLVLFRKGQAMQPPSQDHSGSTSPTTDVDSTTSPPAKGVGARINIPDHLIWQGKVIPAFWTIASLLSLTINLILIIALILLAREVFSIKSLVSTMVDGLHDNFVAMDQAHIRATIPVQETILVNDMMPVVFDLPLHQKTEVVLNREAYVSGATVFLNGAAVRTDIILRKGTRLNINLDMTVPVSQTIPVSLKVPVNLNVQVDIPLDQTELHQPIMGLKGVVAPYKIILDNLPDSWSETRLCNSWTGWVCFLFLGTK